MRPGRPARSLPVSPFSPEYSLSHCLWARPERKSFKRLSFKSKKTHHFFLKISISQIVLDVDVSSVTKKILLLYFLLWCYT